MYTCVYTCTFTTAHLRKVAESAQLQRPRGASSAVPSPSAIGENRTQPLLRREVLLLQWPQLDHAQRSGASELRNPVLLFLAYNGKRETFHSGYVRPSKYHCSPLLVFEKATFWKVLTVERVRRYIIPGQWYNILLQQTIDSE